MHSLSKRRSPQALAWKSNAYPGKCGTRIAEEKDGCYEYEDSTPHRTHHRRTFFRVSAHVTVAQDLLPTRVTSAQVQDEFASLSLHLLEIHHVVTCFIVTCLVSLIILFSSLLHWSRNQVQRAPVHGMVHCLAEWLQSPTTGIQVMSPKT